MPNVTRRSHNIPIIAFAPHPWDEDQWMNRQQLLSRLAVRGWPIIYSHGALSLWGKHTPTWKSASFFPHIDKLDGVHLFRPGKFIPRWPNHPIIDGLAIRYHTAKIRNYVLRKYGTEFISLCFHPAYWPYVKALNPKHIAFHAYDNYAKQGHWDDVHQIYLNELIEHSKLITASSHGIANTLHGAQTRKVHVIENGVDESIFFNVQTQCPDDIRDIPHPRLLYTGAINRKVDIPLIVEIAKNNPNWHWILVGRLEEKELQEDSYLRHASKSLHTLRNIHLLGEKHRTEIPRYISHTDVAVMCYRNEGDGWWKVGSPLKMHEYLASGKPVVSTALETVIPFGSVIDIARTHENWQSSLEYAITYGGKGTIEQRRNVAFSNTWKNRTDTLEELLLKTCA